MTIRCCINCNKRERACHDYCPEYQREKEKLREEKSKRKKDVVYDEYISQQMSKSVLKKHRRARHAIKKRT